MNNPDSLTQKQILEFRATVPVGYLRYCCDRAMDLASKNVMNNKIRAAARNVVAKAMAANSCRK